MAHGTALETRTKLNEIQMLIKCHRWIFHRTENIHDATNEIRFDPSLFPNKI